MYKIKLPLLISFVTILFLFPASSTAQASVLDDFVNGVKKIFTPEPKKEFTIDSKIELAPGGDVAKNGQIDTGDIIRFTYTLTNKTDKDYTFATLKTNINRKQLNFIHNVTGTASLNDDGKTITIPNYRIGASQIGTIIFDARVNYFTDKDPLIATEADFADKEKKFVVKALKKEVKANRIKKEQIPGIKKQPYKQINSKQ